MHPCREGALVMPELYQCTLRRHSFNVSTLFQRNKWFKRCVSCIPRSENPCQPLPPYACPRPTTIEVWQLLWLPRERERERLTGRVWEFHGHFYVSGTGVNRKKGLRWIIYQSICGLSNRLNTTMWIEQLSLWSFTHWTKRTIENRFQILPAWPLSCPLNSQKLIVAVTKEFDWHCLIFSLLECQLTNPQFSRAEMGRKSIN